MQGKNLMDNRDQERKEFDWIWSMNCPNKMKSLLWLTHHGRLSTSPYLNSIGLNIHPNCHTCGHPKKDVEHIFFNCPKAVEFWEAILDNNTTCHKLDKSSLTKDTMQEIWQSTGSKQYNSILPWNALLPQCFWAIWLQRNTNLFNKKKDSTSLANTMNQAIEYHLIIKTNSRPIRTQQTIHVKWEPTAVGRFKLNTDGAVKYTPSPGGLRGVIRNRNGDWKLGFMSKEPQVDPILAELRALKQGLIMAIHHNLMPLDINSDSTEFIKYLTHNNHPYSNLTLECRSLMEKLGATVPTYIFREQNRVADKLSKEGLNCTSFGQLVFWIVPPMFAKKLGWADI
ncbi:hypothetical protein R3W88_016716 [Solanum pinnatisectum]|uniref:RNase H type-1 domain-containing protein n=1 Tax=Solanum pinnatisectum TaxID=50273 RepID=A0AAV9KZH6_9SOLN|nr:hypothetical protein R3W88_016716 [Solanum pinnatisectum]